MHPIQTQYALALSTHDAAVAEATNRTRDIEGDAWESAYEAVREEFKIEQLGQDLIAAEDALLVWAQPFGFTGGRDAKLAQAASA